MTATPLLSDQQMAACRQLQLRTMQQTCHIQRAVSVSDGMGGATETWSTIATVPCRVGAPAGGRWFALERLLADRQAGEIAFVVTVPADTNVKRTDRLLVDSVTYEISAVLAPLTFETARQLLCRVVS